ncbi:hypothetical protein HBB16_20090, partial [Pseudonocardia sp. MCCB 268]|nr:hypothetical protein [Pseudonocardia cytotoxica]
RYYFVRLRICWVKQTTTNGIDLLPRCSSSRWRSTSSSALVLFLHRGLLRPRRTVARSTAVEGRGHHHRPGSAAGGTYADQLGTVPSGSAGAARSPSSRGRGVPPVRCQRRGGETPGLTPSDPHPARHAGPAAPAPRCSSGRGHRVDASLSGAAIAARRHKARHEQRQLVGRRLVCGMLTYMSVPENGAAVPGDAAARPRVATAAALLLCLAVGIISTPISSSIGTLGIVFPLAARPCCSPVSSASSGSSPQSPSARSSSTSAEYSSNRAIVLANAQVADRNAFQQRLLRYCLMIVVVAPVLAFLTRHPADPPDRPRRLLRDQPMRAGPAAVPPFRACSTAQPADVLDRRRVDSRPEPGEVVRVAEVVEASGVDRLLHLLRVPGTG